MSQNQRKKNQKKGKDSKFIKFYFLITIIIFFDVDILEKLRFLTNG